MQYSMFSSEAPRAKPSVSLDFARALLTLEATSHSPTLELLTAIAPSGFFGRTFPAYCHQTEEGILVPFSEDWGNAGMGGRTGFSMRNMSEHSDSHEPSHNGDGVSSLSDVLEVGSVPLRYFLSARACRGILRRAANRGKDLPKTLSAALSAVAEASSASASHEDKTPSSQ